MRTVTVHLLSLLLVFEIGGARADTTRDHVITIDDYFTLAIVSDCVRSPDGNWIAYTDLRWQGTGKPRNRDLWIVHSATKETRRLTFDDAADGSPQWAPDSSFLYFLSARKQGDGKTTPHNGKTQVWRTDLTGGDPIAVTRLDKGVEQFHLSRDGHSIFYTVTDDKTDDPWKKLRTEHKDLEYGHGKRKVSLLWKLDLRSWRTEKVLEPDRYIREFAVADDGTRIALITTPDDRLITNEGQSQVDLYDVGTKKLETLADELWRKQAPSPYGWLESLAWSTDSTRVAFTIGFDGYPPQLFVAQMDSTRSVEEPKIREVTRPEGVTLSGGRLQWQPGTHHLCFLGEDHARQRLYKVHNVSATEQGDVTVVTKGDVVVSSFDVGTDGHATVVFADPNNAEDIYLVSDPGGDYTRLTEVNPQMRTWKLPKIQLVQWTGADNIPVEGVLELPPDHDPKQGKLPLILEIHGGPTSATPYCFRYWSYGRTLFASMGYALLSPNYRGSTGYGDKFMTDLIGRENDIEVKDILAGVDFVIQKGIADPDRLAVMGWSNGGFLTNGIITTTTRFKAASSGAGVVDQFLQWAIEDTPGHVINYMKGHLPWTNREEYWKASPSYKLDRVTTPTLIHVGENDERVPAAHSRALHRALNFYQKVPCELIVYPGAGHGLTKQEHRRAKMEWDVAWFEKYVREKDEPKSETK